MKINEVASDIKDAYIAWQGQLFDANYFRHNFTMSWNDFESSSLFTDIVSPVQFAEIRQKRQFSFSAEDGGIFQIYYDFNPTTEELRKARFAFYQLVSGEVLTAFEKDEMFFRDGELVEGEGSLAIDDASQEAVRWLRIDYDPASANGLTHFSCHAELSGLTDARIVVDAVPWPMQFIETTFALFYPEHFKRVRGTPHPESHKEKLQRRRNAPDPEELRYLLGRITFGR